MAGPIYKFFLAKPMEAWHQLSQEEQESLLAKLGEALEKVGGKTVIMCDSSWSSEQWPLSGVEEFPDIESVQNLSKIHNELDWYRYVEGTTVLGTEWPSA